MIVFASKAEYVESEWVYYEWDMFINAKLKGFKSGNLVTILKGVKVDDINMDLWKYESLPFDNYQDKLIPYVQTEESKARREQLLKAQQAEAEKQQLEQAKIEKQIKLKRELVGLAEDYKKKLTNLSVDIAKIKDKRRAAENITYTCPVCYEESSISNEYCNNCGWEFSPIEGIEGAEYLNKDRKPLIDKMREIRSRKSDGSDQINALNTQIANLKQELSNSHLENDKLSKELEHLKKELSNLRKANQSGQNAGTNSGEIKTSDQSFFIESLIKKLATWLKGLKKRYYLHLMLLFLGCCCLFAAMYNLCKDNVDLGFVILTLTCVFAMWGIAKLLLAQKNGFTILLLNAIPIIFAAYLLDFWPAMLFFTVPYLLGIGVLYLFHLYDKASPLALSKMKTSPQTKVILYIFIFFAISLFLFVYYDNHVSQEYDPFVADTLAPIDYDSCKTDEMRIDTTLASEYTVVLQQLIDNMVKVQGGTFVMGATSEQGSDEVGSDEKPTHSVTLSDYMIGKTEVTQEQWEAVMGSNPSYYSGSNLPVEQVSWNDCQEFIKKLNSLTGLSFRLPTEAEWEYAARGGKKSHGYKYSGSNDIERVAWYTKTTKDKGTEPVATKAPNELGLYDTSGNVYEWCSDWYGSYSSYTLTNPTGPASGSGRVDRGGGWINNARYCRVSLRGYGSPTHSDRYLGLRLAL